ncbi:MAG: hypothetical protein ABMA15_25950 [Vicinamibacterales bacterium]
MTSLNSLPIACTLTPRDLLERLGSIQTLTRRALLNYQRNGLELTLRYAPEAAERVRAMVADEQRCCAFLNFDVQEQSDSTLVTITAPENARDAADELFTQFIAEAPANQ